MAGADDGTKERPDIVAVEPAPGQMGDPAELEDGRSGRIFAEFLTVGVGAVAPKVRVDRAAGNTELAGATAMNERVGVVITVEASLFTAGTVEAVSGATNDLACVTAGAAVGAWIGDTKDRGGAIAVSGVAAEGCATATGGAVNERGGADAMVAGGVTGRTGAGAAGAEFVNERATGGAGKATLAG